MFQKKKTKNNNESLNFSNIENNDMNFIIYMNYSSIFKFI